MEIDLDLNRLSLEELKVVVRCATSIKNKTEEPKKATASAIRKKTYKKRRRARRNLGVHHYSQEEIDLIAGYMAKGLSVQEIRPKMNGLRLAQVHGVVNRLKKGELKSRYFRF